MTLSLESQTYVPERDHERDLHDLRELLINHLSETEGYSSVRAALVGATPEEGVALPLEVVMALLQIVSALESGRAVTVEPHSVLLTTQQAADLLGVSRPTIVKLINSG